MAGRIFLGHIIVSRILKGISFIILSMQNLIFQKQSISITSWIVLKLFILFLFILLSVIPFPGIVLFVKDGITLVILVGILRELGCNFKEIFERYNNHTKQSLMIALKYFGIFILIIGIILGLCSLIYLLITQLAPADFSIKLNNFIEKLINLQNNEKSRILELFLKSKFNFTLCLISLCILGPIGEEIIYRRLLYVTLRKKMSFISSLLISSLVFGIFHFSDIIIAFISGLCLGYMYEKEQDMLANSIWHGFKNFLAISYIIFI